MRKNIITKAVAARRARILEVLRQRADWQGKVYITLPEIAGEIGASLTQVKQDMKRLTQAGQVERLPFHGRLRIKDGAK